MKSIVNTVCGVALAVVFIVFLTVSIYWRWSNADMTETRLFITYWREYLITAVVWTVLAFAYDRTT